MGILLGSFILFCGIAAGLVLGRLFCKQHHKGDVQLPTTDTCQSDIPCCQTGTIGEEIERGGCSPGCCGDKE